MGASRESWAVSPMRTCTSAPAMPAERSRSTAACACCSEVYAAVATGRLAAMARERAVERELRRVADVAGDRRHGVAGVLQPLRGDVHAPPREIRQGRLADELNEPSREGRAREVHLARQRPERPRLGSPIVEERDDPRD